MEDQCGIIILAAGASSRLGEAKQLLVYNQKTLLQHSIEAALHASVQQVVLVLGANADALRPGIADKKLASIVNPAWQEGMASSIRCGLHYLLEQNQELQCVIFMVCDQPFITTALLDNLLSLHKQTGRPIVASQYAATTGIPALFARKIFPELLQLAGDTGAKKLVLQHRGDVVTVPFPQGSIDIDTAADYQQLQKMKT